MDRLDIYTYMILGSAHTPTISLSLKHSLRMHRRNGSNSLLGRLAPPNFHYKNNDPLTPLCPYAFGGPEAGPGDNIEECIV